MATNEGECGRRSEITPEMARARAGGGRCAVTEKTQQAVLEPLLQTAGEGSHGAWAVVGLPRACAARVHAQLSVHSLTLVLGWLSLQSWFQHTRVCPWASFPAESSLLGKDGPPTPTMYKYRPGYSSSSASAAMPHSSSAKVPRAREEVGLGCRPPVLGKRGRARGRKHRKGEKRSKAYCSLSALVVLSLLAECPSPQRGPCGPIHEALRTASAELKGQLRRRRRSLTCLRLTPCCS